MPTTSPYMARATQVVLSMPQVEIDPDSVDTRPINKLAVLRADARDTIALRDAIDDCSSPEWQAAHEEARTACQRVYNEVARRAQGAKILHSPWSTPADIEMLALGQPSSLD